MRSPEHFHQAVEEFRARKDKAFCEELFRDLTVRLLAFKYSYYVLDDNLVKDATYDNMEQCWKIMGIALGHLTENHDAGVCVGFDTSHPLAEEGRKLAIELW